MRGYFAQVRRAGFDIGLSPGKLAKAMVEVLSQLPPEVTPSKGVVVQRLGLLGQMSKTRGINAAWSSAKSQVVREQVLGYRMSTAKWSGLTRTSLCDRRTLKFPSNP